MSRSLKRAKAPFLAGLALAAVALAIPVAANAAMGTANPITTTLRPDLRSATVVNVNPVDVTTTVRFCFNKDIASLPDASDLSVGTYRQAEATADTATRSSARCADAVFSTTDIDVTQHTYGTADFGAVRNLANGDANRSDSTPLIGSSTNNGTRGKSTAPDLVGITVSNAANTINFIFDQNVLSGSAVPANFELNNNQGDTLAATSATTSANVVAAKFPAGGLVTVASAVRAYVEPGAVQARTTGNDTNAALMSAARPGNSGFTTAPDLLSATLAGAANKVDFVFDETILPPVLAVGNFTVTRSDATPINASAVERINGNTVRATFPDGDSQNEYFVLASAADDAVISATTALPSTPGGLPVGGNAGAFAQGYTTGPEALSVTFDNATGVARILLDQRFFTSDFGSFRLLDDSGTQTGSSPINVTGAGGPAGQVTAQVTFTPAQLQGARSIQLFPGALVSFIGAPRGANVVQALSPTATATVLSKGSEAKFRKATGKLKNTKQLRAVKRAYR